MGFRRGLFRYAEVAMGGAGMVAVLLAGLKLLETQPGDAFQVLRAWGPWPFIALVFLALVGTFVNRLNDTIQSAFTQVVESAQQSAHAQQQMAAAITQVAQKDDRQLQEIQTLAGYTAQQAQMMHRRQKRTDRMLTAIAIRLHVSDDEIASADGDHDG